MCNNWVSFGAVADVGRCGVVECEGVWLPEMPKGGKAGGGGKGGGKAAAAGGSKSGGGSKSKSKG